MCLFFWGTIVCEYFWKKPCNCVKTTKKHSGTSATSRQDHWVGDILSSHGVGWWTDSVFQGLHVMFIHSSFTSTPHHNIKHRSPALFVFNTKTIVVWDPHIPQHHRRFRSQVESSPWKKRLKSAQESTGLEHVFWTMSWEGLCAPMETRWFFSGWQWSWERHIRSGT